MSKHKHLDLFLNVISSSSPIASLLPPIRLSLPLFPHFLCCFLPYLMWLEPILKGNTKCTFTSSLQLFHVDTVALQQKHLYFGTKYVWSKKLKMSILVYATHFTNKKITPALKYKKIITKMSFKFIMFHSPGLSLVCLDFHDLIQLKPYKPPFSLHPSPTFILHMQHISPIK